MSHACLTQLDFPYRVVRSKRKSAAIHVRLGLVEVRIPYYVEDTWALEFLHSKQNWVRQKLAQQASQHSLRPTLEAGQPILWQGQEKTLELDPNSSEILLHDSRLIIGMSKSQTIQPLLERLFKHQAREYMLARTWQVAKKYGLDHKLADVKFRRTKTKWGHCTSKGVIQYNWLIMGAPQAVIDYLICHEVCHLRHHNHSPTFWQLVALHCPDYKEQQAWLKHNSIRLSWC